MLRTEKEALVADIQKDFERSAGVLFLDFTGLTVGEADGFRRKMRDNKVRYLVAKNTLVKRALDGRPYEDAARCLKGTPTGVVFGYDDPVTSAKLVFEYMQDCKHLRVKGGVLDGKAITPAEAESLSKMPSKGELQASIVQLAQSPGRKLMGQLASPASRIVGAIDALVKRLEG